MLTQRKKARKGLRHEANRAASQVASKAQGAMSGAGEVAKTARKVPHQVSDRAGQTVTGARRRAASGLFNTASRLSSAAEVVEHGHRPRRRRWPLVAALAAVLAATGVVVTKVARGLRGRRETADETTTSGDGRETGAGDGQRTERSEPVGKIPQPGDAKRTAERVSSSTASASHNNNSR